MLCERQGHTRIERKVGWYCYSERAESCLRIMKSYYSTYKMYIKFWTYANIFPRVEGIRAQKLRGSNSGYESTLTYFVQLCIYLYRYLLGVFRTPICTAIALLAFPERKCQKKKKLLCSQLAY